MKYGVKSKRLPQDDKPSPSQALIGVSGHWVGSSVEWTVSEQKQVVVSLTPAELKALEAKHQSRTLNMERIVEVKRMMQEGNQQAKIIQRLRGRKGFGERQIKKDMAALSKFLK